MGGLTLEDFSQSKAYKEIFGLGEANLALRQLKRRCGPLSETTTARIQALPLEQLEDLVVGADFSEGVLAAGRLLLGLGLQRNIGLQRACSLSRLNSANTTHHARDNDVE